LADCRGLCSTFHIPLIVEASGIGDQILNVTETDLAIAAALYPILVECARQTPARAMTYGALIDEAKARLPNDEAVQNAIPVSLGRRLDVVRMFLNKEALPDITVLVVNAETGEVGSAFGVDPDKVRAEVTAFDWSAVAEEFDLHISGLRKGIEAAKRPKISRDTAKQMMFEYGREHRAALPKDIGRKREAIIDLICAGNSAEDAFNLARGA
jgi:hypothetical protein